MLRTRPPRPHPLAALALGLLLLVPPLARAQAGPPGVAPASPDPRPAATGLDAADCDARAEPSRRSFDFRLDNDLIGGQDEGYTGGIWVSVGVPADPSPEALPCLPALARGWVRLTRGLEPARPDGRQLVYMVGQALWTPSDGDRRDLIVDDRPYAAALVASLVSNVREGDRLHVSALRVGMVGPAVGGRHLQAAIHRITGSKRLHGWSNQLHNEPVFQLAHDRLWRWRGPGAAVGRPGWGQDLIVHAGGSLGTLVTSASTGLEWRFGSGIGNDFGSVPLRLGGENAGARPRPPRSGLQAHGFVNLEGRWLLRDISLDGNTFRHSHSVHRRPLSAMGGYGVALNWDDWKLVIGRYHRNREFDGQDRAPVFGSITLSHPF